MWGAESGRRSPLPENWPALRRYVLERDHGECQWRGPDPFVEVGPICGYLASDVDHKGPDDDHRPEMLRALCATHHGQRTSAQGNAARWRHRQERPRERHPGILPG